MAVLLAVSACRDTRVNGKGCRSDGDCGSPASAYRCDTQTGSCFCRTDDACPSAQFCNAVGFCQDRAGCQTNADCLDPSLFCDTTQGSCLPFGRCSVDLQCPLGQICDTRRATCVDGCRRNGDCDQVSCRCGDTACSCTGTTPEEVARCPVGVCDPAFCADNTFCRYGEQCGVVDGGSPRATCYSDYDSSLRPYCDNCTFGGGVSVCGTGPNYCLIDTANPGNYFCGSDCSSGQTCPHGYECADVIVVYTQWSCSRTNPSCPVNPALSCATDADCARGGKCAIPPGLATGFCAGQCSIAEGDSTGFCSCQVDADCAPESCVSGECSISRKPCIPGDPNACKSIHCVDFEGSGGCLIGQNCAPGNGLSCVQVR